MRVLQQGIGVGVWLGRMLECFWRGRRRWGRKRGGVEPPYNPEEEGRRRWAFAKNPGSDGAAVLLLRWKPTRVARVCGPGVKAGGGNKRLFQ